ncbi:MAG: hypothetical protein WDN26_11285 [Chitinophagaceae bacterium]
MGLKAYDLVWVPGKSAAWRYPGELEELKQYAPLVEEQPFDRFFKKNTEGKKAEAPPVAKEPVVEMKKSIDIEEKYQKYIPKRSVVVTLPGQRTVTVQKPVASKPAPIPEPLPTVTVVENPASAQVKYSQPLDEIKEMYVKTLSERKTKIARKGFLVKNMKKAAVVVGLIAAGVLAGFILKPGSDKKDSISRQIAQSPAAVVNEPVQEQTQEILPQTQETTDSLPIILPPEEVKRFQSSIIENTTVPRKVKPQPSQEEIRKETNMIVEKNKKNEKENTDKNKIDNASVPAAGVELSGSVLNGDRNRKVRDNNNPVESYVANTSINNDETRVVKHKKSSGLESLVSVGTNAYTKVAFGGIRNLELTVTNDSKFVLDKVIVELQYMKPSEQPLRTEMIQFRSVAPNESVTKRIADTNRGIKVTYKIVDIQSTQSETAASGF